MRDKEIANLIKKEEARQGRAVNLIASENIVSDDVREALGSVFVNKYAEGYPGKRYYGGNKVSDELELLAQERALALFGLSPDDWGVNVQPLSGSPANLAVYTALVPHGGPPSHKASEERGKIMGMELSHGGHLTHGHKVSATGMFWKQVPYGVSRDTEQLDYNEIAAIAKKEKPALIVAGFTAYPRVIDFKKFRKIADSCGAYLMVDMSHFAGLVAGGVYPSPFYEQKTDTKHSNILKNVGMLADVVTTTTHKTLRGPRSAMIFSRKKPVGNSAHRVLSKLHAKEEGLTLRMQGGKVNPFAKSFSQVSHSALTIAQAIDRAVFPGLQGGPHLNQIAAVAVALKEASEPSFKKYAAQVVKNARALADTLTERGWRIVSGGTDTHLLLVDTWMNGAGIGGKEASERLEKEGIIVNKNTIPFDTRPPTDPSGIRLGTPAETTRGAKEKDMREIAERIDSILRKK